MSDTGPVEVVYDNSPPTARRGVLVGFAEGNQGRALFALSRRPTARAPCWAAWPATSVPGRPSPAHYVDMVWAREQYTGGAYGSFNPPGVHHVARPRPRPGRWGTSISPGPTTPRSGPATWRGPSARGPPPPPGYSTPSETARRGPSAPVAPIRCPVRAASQGGQSGRPVWAAGQRPVRRWSRRDRTSAGCGSMPNSTLSAAMAPGGPVESPTGRLRRSGR